MGAPWAVVLLVVCAVFALLVGAVVLQLACRMCRARTPGFGAALILFLVITFLNGVVGFGVGMVAQLATSGASHGATTPAVRIVVLVVTLLLNLLVSGRFYSATLEDVSPGKGMLIWLAQQFLYFLIAVAVGALLFLLGLPFGGLGSPGLSPVY